jgi:two-component system catabolic regulation response regulator CreB/two-component system response regulator ChvI
MTWSDDMYRGFLTYFERLNQLYRDYILNIQKLNESYNESIKLIERMNDIHKEFVENYTKMNQLYKQHFEDMQRMNQQWFNLFWRPFMGQQQQQEREQTTQRKMDDSIKNNSTRNGRSRRILLVDDDVDITTSLKIGLEDNGFSVDAFNDPLLALSNFRPGLYDLLLFDVRMPQLSGLDLYNKIKKEKNNNQDLKVCYITAYDIKYEELRKQFPDSHVDCFIKKPIQISDLVRRANAELES